MNLTRRIAPLVMAGMMSTGAFVGISALTEATAQAATCTDPGPATNFTTPGGQVDIAAYLAAVAAFNACVSGGSAGGGTAPGASTAPARALAFTGSDSKSLGAAGIALAGLGAGAIVVSRRRRHA